MSLFHSDAFLAFRSRDFSLLSINQLCLILAIMIQEVVIAYSVYQLTQNPLSLGMIALIELLPFICLSLFMAIGLTAITDKKLCSGVLAVAH